MDPVTLGLCSQMDLDFEVGRANKDRPQQPDQGATLMPAEITTGPRAYEEEAQPSAESLFGSRPSAPREEEEEIDVAAVQKDIVRIEAELADVRAKMAGYLKELGVDV
jgi:hypothetical protein